MRNTVDAPLVRASQSRADPLLHDRLSHAITAPPTLAPAERNLRPAAVVHVAGPLPSRLHSAVVQGRLDADRVGSACDRCEITD